jgi:hypothetical protein
MSASMVRSNETMTIPSSVLNIDTSGYSNLLTANQSSVETDLTGLSTLGSTLTRDTSIFKSGVASLKVDTDNAGIGEGVSMGVSAIGSMPYTFSTYVKGAGTIRATIVEYSGSWVYAGSSNGDVVTLNDEWQLVKVTRTLGASATSMKLRIQTDVKQDITFYADCLQISATSSAKPWILGGTQVNAGAGTIEFEILYPVTPMPTYNSPIQMETGTNTVNRFLMFMPATSAICLDIKDNISQGNMIQSGAVINRGWNKIGMTFNKDNKSVFCTGLKVVENNTPNTRMPTAYPNTVIHIGSGGPRNYYINGILRNITFSTIKRVDAEMLLRYLDQEGFPADKYCSAILPLQGDLEALRVVPR